jgi:hypothetical protein
LATAKKQRVPITERALVQRINRKLKADGERLIKARGSQTATSFGDWYIVDEQRNVIASQRVDPETLARKIGALRPWEALNEGD